MSAQESMVLSFHCSTSGSEVLAEIVGSVNGPGAEERTRVRAFRVTRRSSGWLTVMNRDEFEEEEL